MIGVQDECPSATRRGELGQRGRRLDTQQFVRIHGGVRNQPG